MSTASRRRRRARLQTNLTSSEAKDRLREALYRLEMQELFFQLTKSLGKAIMAPENDDLRREAEALLSRAEFPSGLGEAASSLHEMYLSLKSGGFTEFQALWIIGYVCAGGPNPVEPPEESGKS